MALATSSSSAATEVGEASSSLAALKIVEDAPNEQSVNVKPASSTTLKLMSSDNKVFEVTHAVALQIGTIKSMVEVEADCADTVIPVANVDAETLAKVLEWCEKHAASRRGVATEEELKKELEKWEEEFVDVDQTVLYEMMMAANYLNVMDLVRRVARKVADMIRGKHPDAIRQILGIENDFPPEERERIQNDHSWAFPSV